MTKLMDHVRRVVLAEEHANLCDGQLLESFIRHRDEAAVEVLVRRHAAMVWGVCRRVLGDSPDAEDAFQATFLVLIRRAASIKPREMVANWLYGVARQSSLKARALIARRRQREWQVTYIPEPEIMEQDLWNEMQPLLDREISRLSDKYRAAIVLCDLEGRSRKEAARQLKIPEGTLSSRLTTARRVLAKRLARYRLAVSGGALGGVLTHNSASASIPVSVVSSAARAATLMAAAPSATVGVISSHALTLMEGVLKTMLICKLRFAATVLLISALVGGLGFGTHRALAEKPAAAKPDTTAKPAVNADNDKKANEKPENPADVNGIIAAVSDDARTIKVDIPAPVKGDPPTTVEIKVTDKTKLSYFGVDSNGENPMVGYTILVWFEEGSKEKAAGVRLGRKEGLDTGKGPDFAGQITAVAKDDRSITLEVPPENKGEAPKKIEVKFTEKTKFSYFGVDPASETPTVGYVALVWLMKDSKDTAVGVRLGLKK
jgi:RNA polymerase sigma factor (sigma-70 family)